MTKADTLKAIRRMCITCMGGTIDDENVRGYSGELIVENIKECTSGPSESRKYEPCPLFIFRFGKDPFPNEVKSRLAKERVSKSFGRIPTSIV